MINLGNINITKIYLGDSNISKVYYGEELIFGGGGDDTKQANFPFTDENWVVNDQGKTWKSNQALSAMSPFVVDEVSVSFSGGSIFAKPTHMLTYLNLTMQTKIMITAPAHHKLKKITFTTPSGYSFGGMSPTVNNGSFVETNVWEGNTDSLTLSFSQASRLIGMEVEYEELIPKLYTFRYTTTDGNIARPYVEADVASNNYYGDYGELVYKVYENTLPNSFFRYNAFLKEIEIPEGIPNIPTYAFHSDSNLEKVVIPTSVTSIGNYAFQQCTSLTSITIPEGVTIIPIYAFDGCTSLTSVTIPNSVTTIGNYAFQNVLEMGELYCSAEWYLKLSSGNVTNLGNVYNWVRHYADVSNNEILYTSTDGLSAQTTDSPGVKSLNDMGLISNTYENGIGKMTFNKQVTSIGRDILYNTNTINSVILPESVTSIGDNAFNLARGLTSINIPSSVTYIGSSAFRGCKITSCYIPEGITSIKNYAFQDCYRLTSVTIPDSVTSIGNNTFDGCSILTSIEIPNTVTSIGERAFYGCSGFTSIGTKGSGASLEIPTGVTRIEIWTFSNCASLTSITIPQNIEFIGDVAFKDNNKITQLSVENGNLTYDSRNNCNAIIETATNTLICGISKTYIPESVTSIGTNAFSENYNITSIVIPENVTTINNGAFYRCTKLTDITIYGTPTTINANAFRLGSSTGTLTCKQSWFNELDSRQLAALGYLATDSWTKVWLDEDIDDGDEGEEF